MGIYRGAFVVSCRIDPSLCLTCRVSANGYEALPGNELEDEKKAAREQEELEDRYEKMLMDVYDTLYKVHLHHLLPSYHIPGVGMRFIFIGCFLPMYECP